MLGVFHALGLAVGDDDGGVIQEAVEDADRGGLLRQESAPLFEGPVRADRQVLGVRGGPIVGKDEHGHSVATRRLVSRPSRSGIRGLFRRRRLDDRSEAGSGISPWAARCRTVVGSGPWGALICDNPNTIRGDVSNMTQPPREPGWYPDPSDPSKNIYWDGSAWQGSPTSVEADESGSSKKIGIAIAVIVLGLVGTVMAQQSVSLLSGTGQIWTGVAIAGVALALSYFLGASTWVRVIASICLVSSLFSAIYMETQLSEKRQELRQIFNS